MTLTRFATFLSLAAALAATACGAEPAIEFSGVLTDNGKARLALTDKATGLTRWLETGGDFDGYTVASYDAKDDAVTVKKDGTEYRLPLVASKTHSTGPIAGALVPSTSPPVATLPPPTPTASAAGLPTGPMSPTAPGSAMAAPPSGGALMPVAPPPSVPVDTAAPASPAAAPAAVSPPLNYTVQPGDSLAKIAATSGLSLTQLQSLNPGVNPNALQAGQAIRIR